MFLSVIMTALNEENNIELALENTLKAFNDFSIVGEIIIINDGSLDKTELLISNAMEKDNRIRIINHSEPKGVGTSFWDGVDAAKGDVVVWFPADNENDPWEILRYYQLLEQVDIVIPFVFNKEARSLFRNVLSFTYRFIINTTFLVNFNYTNGTVLYRRSILKELDYHGSSFFFQTDILIRSVKRGYLFAEVPYRLGMRSDGLSKAVTFPSLVNVIKGYLRLVKDFYFNGHRPDKMVFSEDSLTAKRKVKINK